MTYALDATNQKILRALVENALAPCPADAETPEEQIP